MALQLNNFYPIHPRMLRAEFGRNWPSSSAEEDFQMSLMYIIFLLFRNYLSLENSLTLHLNKLESPLPRDALCQVWLKLTQWFWRNIFLYNFVNVFLLFRNYLPLEKSVALYLNKLKPPSSRAALCQVWLKLAQ